MEKPDVVLLDASILFYDPNVFEEYENITFVIPLSVLEELDKKKREATDRGESARKVLRLIDETCQGRSGCIKDGVKLSNGCEIYIDLEQVKEKADFFIADKLRYRMIRTAKKYQETGRKVAILSRDLVLKAIAELSEVEAIGYVGKVLSYEEIKSGIRTLSVSKKDVDAFYAFGKLEMSDSRNVQANAFCVAKADEKSSFLAVADCEQQCLLPLTYQGDEIWGIKDKNIEQRCALDLLLRKEIELVCLLGPAGTGKTMLAVAAALKQVFDDGDYQKIVVSRATQTVGTKDIGFLPGTKEEKMYHWLAGLWDNIENICHSSGKSDGSEVKNWILESNKLEVEAVSYMRGRSFSKAFIIIDEAQNLTPHEIKTIITRAGEGSKIVLTGDIEQIDNPYLDLNSNGLVYVANRMKECPFFGSVYLHGTVRSAVADFAAKLL